jgi:hypothetical protein
MTKSPLDPLIVAQVLAGLVLSPNLATIVGPYAMIFIAAIGGAAASLADDKTVSTRWDAFTFFFRGILTSLLFTVPTSSLVAAYFHWDSDWLLLAMAATLSYASGKWRIILAFTIAIGRRWITNFVDRGAPK